MRSKEPEREMVRRALPFLLIGVAIAFALGAIAGGPGVGVSAAVGAVVVLVNFAANGYSLAWAARTSPAFLGVVAALSFVVRIAVVFAVVAILRSHAFFSTKAFALSVVPLMVLLLAFEVKMVSGPMGRQIDIPDGGVAR